MAYSAYSLSRFSQQLLLTLYPPKFNKVIAEHITVKFPSSELPNTPSSVWVYGYGSNDRVQALAVSVDGKTRRKDGKLFHITLSVAEGAKPVESADMLESNLTLLPEWEFLIVTPVVLK